MEMKTLTVNGQTYTVADPDAAHIDDTVVGDKAWSGKNIVDKLCPAFSESGGVVTCQPVEGYPLAVVSRIDPVQAGKGTPGPDNVRPITGFSAVTLTHNETPITAQLGQTVYCGSYDWNTGLLTVTKAVTRLTSDMRWTMTGSSNPNGIYSFFVDKDMENVISSGPNYPVVSSHYCFYENGWSVSNVPYGNAIKILNKRIYIADARFTNLDAFKGFLDGETVQLLYFLATPVIVQLEPRQILALSGENTLQSDTGDTTVTGRADLSALLQSLLPATE